MITSNKDSIIRSYIKEVSSKLECSRGVSSVFLRELKRVIWEFAESGGEISSETLYERFGTPEEISAGFFDREDYSLLLARAKKKVLVWRCIGIAASVLLAFAVCFYIYLVIFYDPGIIQVSDVYIIYPS